MMTDHTYVKELNFLPSLPMHSREVSEATARPQFSHRCQRYIDIFNTVQEKLMRIMGTDQLYPVLSAGSGTFANEMMLASTMSFRGENLVLSNGEFGSRMAEQGKVYDPGLHVLDFGFNVEFDLDRIEQTLKENSNIRQMFFVLSETSAGMMNPLDELVKLAEKYDVLLSLDAISAIGMMPFDFTSPVFACVTGTSGKVLAGVPGISIVFAKPGNLPGAKNISHILDVNFQLERMKKTGNVHHTMSSLLLTAFDVALSEVESHGLEKLHQHYRGLKAEISKRFAQMGLEALKGSSSPIVTSFKKPDENKQGWDEITRILKSHKVNVYDNVPYLIDKQLFQIATMGPAFQMEHIDRLEAAFKAALKK